MNKNLTTTVNYTGTVTTKFEKNGKIYNIQKFHNAGTTELYKFISYCLAGKYQSAEALRPQYIKLFCNLDPTPPVSNGVSQNVIALTQPILINASSSPSPWVTDTAFNGYKTTLHFIIPFAHLNNVGATGNILKINELRLYSKTNKDSDKACSAYFYCTSTDQGNGQPVWSYIEPEDNFNNYNLIVEWEMRISNLVTVEETD